MSQSKASAFARLEVRAPTAEAAERLAAEANAAGASGLEERGDAGDSKSVTLVVYAPLGLAEDVRAALEAEARRAGAGSVGPPEPVAEEAWEETWRDGIALVRVSARLAVRPSFVADDSQAGTPALLVEPGQAFGTGSHESTWLALALLDALPTEAISGVRVLDVGTGSGVLALAAISLGARSAVGFDLDPLAAPAARGNARANPRLMGLSWFTGPVAALDPSICFDIVLANLLRSELEPVVDDIATRLQPEGYAILSGLLVSDLPRLTPRLERSGLEPDASRERADADGARWVGLRVRRVGRLTSHRGSGNSGRAE